MALRSTLPVTLLVSCLLCACGEDDGGVLDTDTQTGGETEGSETSDPDAGDGETGDATADGTTSNADGSGEGTTGTDTGSGEGSTGMPVECVEDVVQIDRDGFFPEGIDADADGNLYVTSVPLGEIVKITPCAMDGEETVVETFVEPGEDVDNFVGARVDAARDILWVCSTGVLQEGPASIRGYSLADGSLVAAHPFPAEGEDPGFCNDLDLDADGNVYATDSKIGRILRVAAADAQTDGIAAEVWANDSAFTPDTSDGFGINGIAFDGDSSLYVVNSDEGSLLRVAISETGTSSNPDEIDLVGEPLVGADGLRWLGNDTLLVVENALGAEVSPALTTITLVASEGTVSRIDTNFDVPTTAAVVGDFAWVVQSQFDHLFGLDRTEPTVPFEVVRRALPEGG